MKFLHLSDLHLGKRLNEFSLLEDQAFILTQILRITDDEQPNGVLIAGDVYDKAAPSAEAVALFDDFLAQLAARAVSVFVISGNHDSPERIAFGAQLVRRSKVYLSPVYDGQIRPVTLEDEHGPVDVFLLPFLKPMHVRRWFPEAEIESYTDAIACAVAHMPVDPARRNVLVTHQFVTGAVRCESEELTIGGSDNVDAAVFAPFDYVALGHIHSPQNVSGSRVRYCGTPLKYSFSEARQQKSVTVAELAEKGTLTVRTVPLQPQRDLVELRGSFQAVAAREVDGAPDPNAYVHITLTDEADIPEAVGKLRAVYPNLMRLDYDNSRTRGSAEILGVAEVEHRSPLELFDEFYALQNNQPMRGEQRAYLQGLIEQIWGGEA
ncbi:MAG: exonuclease SbcCD subunit D [Oscillospiraceae bacterium]|nr:exonuclease SbcCD subunit D [Oscillospiraceae bacterium]